MNEAGIIIPVVFFCSITFAITYVVKLLVGARVRVKMLQSCSSAELIQSIVQSEDHLSRMASLRWGIVLTMEAIGFGLIQYAGWITVTPGVVGLLIGAFGLGSLVYFLVARRLS
jgi:hypothetical protein